MIAHRQGNEPGTEVVTFIIEPRVEHAAGAIAVVGDFNDWDPTVDRFAPGVDGRWRATVSMTTGRRYVFRYLAENGDWFDEPDADERRDDGQGRVNCVLDLACTQRPAPKPSPGGPGPPPAAAEP